MMFRADADLLLPVLGPAYQSHPDERQVMLERLQSEGADIDFRPKQLGYSPVRGSPGRFIVDPDASIAAMRHEYDHFLFDRALGYPGLGYYLQNPSVFWESEFSAYLQEIAMARSLREFGIARNIVGQMRNRRRELLGY